MLLRSFPQSGFFNFGNNSKSGGLSPPNFDLFPKMKKLLLGKRFRSIDAFVVDASDYSAHLIRHLPNASEEFPTEWFLQFWEQVKVWWAEPTQL
jgi:hypothetical protein